MMTMIAFLYEQFPLSIPTVLINPLRDMRHFERFWLKHDTIVANRGLPS